MEAVEMVHAGFVGINCWGLANWFGGGGVNDNNNLEPGLSWLGRWFGDSVCIGVLDFEVIWVM